MTLGIKTRNVRKIKKKKTNLELKFKHQKFPKIVGDVVPRGKFMTLNHLSKNKDKKDGNERN